MFEQEPPRVYRSYLVEPLSRGRGALRADGLRWRSVAWSNRRSLEARFSSGAFSPGGMTRIISPCSIGLKLLAADVEGPSELLVPASFHRIESHGAARWNIAGKECDGGQQHRHRGERCWVEGFDSE